MGPRLPLGSKTEHMADEGDAAKTGAIEQWMPSRVIASHERSPEAPPSLDPLQQLIPLHHLAIPFATILRNMAKNGSKASDGVVCCLRKECPK
jgi:hypothetical protein